MTDANQYTLALVSRLRSWAASPDSVRCQVACKLRPVAYMAAVLPAVMDQLQVFGVEAQYLLTCSCVQSALGASVDKEATVAASFYAKVNWSMQ